MPTTDDAIRGALDALTADASLAARGVSADACICILDGSMFAPSWRVIDALERIWQSDDNGDNVEQVNDELTRWETNVELPDGCSVGWSEGCLFVFGADFDHASFE